MDWVNFGEHDLYSVGGSNIAVGQYNAEVGCGLLAQAGLAILRWSIAMAAMAVAWPWSVTTCRT